MSYCRAGEQSDLYIIHNIYGYLECMCKEKGYKTKSRQDMVFHILAHAIKGHKVQQHAVDRLRKEINEKGDLVT